MYRTFPSDHISFHLKTSIFNYVLPESFHGIRCKTFRKTYKNAYNYLHSHTRSPYNAVICYAMLILLLHYLDCRDQLRPNLLSCCIFSVCTSCDQAVFIYFVYDTAIFLDGFKCIYRSRSLSNALCSLQAYSAASSTHCFCSSVKLLYLLAPDQEPFWLQCHGQSEIRKDQLRRTSAVRCFQDHSLLHRLHGSEVRCTARL